MKKNNLKKLSNISNDILNSMLIFEDKEQKEVVYVPKSKLEAWQRELFQIVKNEVDKDNH